MTRPSDDARGLPFYVAATDAPAKREVLQAALRLFVRDGISETSIRTIGTEAGYTNPALFKHFRSKDELALRLFEHCYLKLSGDLQTAVRLKGDFAARMNAIISCYVCLLDQHPDAVLYVQENLRHFWPLVAPRLRRQAILPLLRKLLGDGQQSGAVTTTVSVEWLTTAWVGLLQQFGRAVYFGEITGNAEDWRTALTELTSRLTRP